MTYSDIKAQLRVGNLDNFYIFTGSEIYVRNEYIKQIAEKKGQTIKRVDSVRETVKTGGLSLLKQSFCFVCGEDAEFQKSEGLWGEIERLAGQNTIIYITDTDKRSKFCTYWADRIVDFEPMSVPVLKKHIRKHLQLSGDNQSDLIEVCESDFARILLEVDKIEQYSKATGKSADVSYFELKRAGAIYQPPTDAIFAWVDAVMAGKPRLSFKLLRECQALGEPSLRLLLVLYQNVKRVLQVQSCTAKDIVANTGLTEWEVNLAKKNTGVYRIGELVEELRVIKSLETGIKTGQVAEEDTVPFAMVSLFREDEVD